MKKIAIMFFGQLRLNHGDADNYNSLISSIKNDLGDNTQIDIYIHCWYSPLVTKYEVSSWSWCVETGEIDQNIIQYMLDIYKPLKCLIEKPKTFDKTSFNESTTFLQIMCMTPEAFISNVISHMYSVQEVSKLVDQDQQYDYYILTRFDYKYKGTREGTKLCDMSNDELWQHTDFINIFKNKNLLHEHKILLSYIKNNVLCSVNAEKIRDFLHDANKIQCKENLNGLITRKHDRPLYVTNMLNDYKYTKIVNGSLACEIEEGDIIKITKHESRQIKDYQWIGKILSLGQNTVNFSIMFTDIIPIPTPFNMFGSKTHDPDFHHQDWLREVKETGKWYDIKLEVNLTHPLFIYLFCDNYLGEFTCYLKIENP